MILQKYLEINITKNFNYYIEKGYEISCKGLYLIKNEDVQKGSKVKEKRQCDFCGEIVIRTHRDWEHTKKSFGKDCCPKCAKRMTQEKIISGNLEKYGVRYPMQFKEIRDKARKNNLEKYGVDYAIHTKENKEKRLESFKKKYNGATNPQQVKRFQEKTKQTNLKKYGPENVFANDEIKEKIKETILNKYGTENVSQSEIIKKKKENTTLKNYGVTHPMQSLEIKERARKTLTENGSIPTSKPQIELFNMCKKLFPNAFVELNAPLSSLSLDIKIVFPNDFLVDLEYDGWFWHQDKQKDYARDAVVKKFGYKIVRIQSATMLPNENQLLEAIKTLKESEKTFYKITLSDWKENKQQ